MPALSEVYNRDIAVSFLDKEPMRKNPFTQSGAFVSSAELRNALATDNPTIEYRWIDPLDSDLEPNYGNTVFTDIVTPRSIEGGSLQGRGAYVNEMFGSARLATALSKMNANEIIAGKIDAFWNGYLENRAVATLLGVRNFDQANGKELTLDISNKTGDAAKFSVEAFLDAESQMGDAFEGQGAIVMHKTLRTELRKTGAIERSAPTDDLPSLEYYNGRQIITSNRGTLVAGKYVTYLLGNGAFAAEMLPQANDMVQATYEDRANGAGFEALHTRRKTFIHPQGFDFVLPKSELTGGTKNEALWASWTDLARADAWDMPYKADNIGIQFLITK